MVDRRVAVLIESSPHARGVLSGIGQFVQTHEPWVVDIREHQLDEPPPAWLEDWKGDGILIRGRAMLWQAQTRQMLSKVPVVYLGEPCDVDLPMVCSDDRAIARKVAEHFLDKGHRQFGFVGLAGRQWSMARGKAFEAAVEAKGGVCQHLELALKNKEPNERERQDQMMADWLKKLPNPVGVMACCDQLGMRLLNCARQLGIAIPEQVALVGVDNDHLLCNLGNPPLSSVTHQVERIGFTGAKLLSQMISGKCEAKWPVLIAPQSLVARQSSDVLAIDDPSVSVAIRFIRHNACRGIQVNDVVEAVGGISAVTLKRRFDRAIGHSPKAEIIRVRLERVKQLLEVTDYTLETIASLAGFRHPEYMSNSFLQKTGQSPGRFRQMVRANMEKTPIVE